MSLWFSAWGWFEQTGSHCKWDSWSRQLLFWWGGTTLPLNSVERGTTMRNLTMLTLAVCLLGVGGWSGTARAATFQVIVVSAKVLPTKANRNCWDLCTPWQRRELFGLSRGLRVHKGKNAWAATMTSAQAALQLQGSTMPDPYVTLRFQNGQVLRSRVLHNTVNPQWGRRYRLT
jgi:hypothetical protein